MMAIETVFWLLNQRVADLEYGHHGGGGGGSFVVVGRWYLGRLTANVYNHVPCRAALLDLKR